MQDNINFILNNVNLLSSLPEDKAAMPKTTNGIQNAAGRKYRKNGVQDSDWDQILIYCLNNGILKLDGIIGLEKEAIMQTILDNIHKYGISQLPDGRYYTYVPDATKPNGRRQIRKKTLSSMFKCLITFYGLAGQQYSNMTFRELYAEWVDYKKLFLSAKNAKKSLSPSTIRRYERDFDHYIAGTELENACISAVTSTFLQKQILGIISNHQLNERCAGNLLGYIHQAFQYAYMSRYLSENPAALTDRRLMLANCETQGMKEDEERILTNAELSELRKRILEHQAKQPGYLPDYAIELALLTGMRVGELAALKWASVDDFYIHVDFSEHRLDFKDRKSEFVIGEPKNRKHRRIPLTDSIRALLQKIRNITKITDAEYVFANRNGERCSARAISCAARKRCMEAGIENGSIHRIRRTVSSLLNQVLPQKDVAAMLGHTERVNEQCYNYSTAELEEKRKALTYLSSKVIDFIPADGQKARKNA